MVGRRWRAAATAVVAVTVIVLAGAAPSAIAVEPGAEAAVTAGPATLAISPAGPYLDDQRVTVTAGGLAPSTAYVLLECTVDGCVHPDAYDGSQRRGSDPFPRDPPRQAARYLTTDAAGGIIRSIDLVRSVSIGGSPVDCSAVACDLVAVQRDTMARDAATPLSFQPTGTYVWPQATLELGTQVVGASGTVHVTASGLDHWRISLWGFVPWQWVKGATPEVCASGNQAPTEGRCEAIEHWNLDENLGWPQVAVDGTTTAPVRIPASITAGGQPWDCRASPCTLRLVQPKVATNEVRLVTSQPWAPWASARAMVDELSHLVGADSVPETVRADLTARLDAGTTSVVDALTEIGVHDRAAGDVATLYATLLARRPDRAGLEYWTARLRAGTVSAGRIGDLFANTLEVRARYARLFPYEVVDKAYDEILRRTPDEAGRRYWMDRLAAGVPVHRMLAMIALSPEARARTVTPRTFTASLLGLLDREMTQEEHWRTYGADWRPHLMRAIIDEAPVFDSQRAVGP